MSPAGYRSVCLSRVKGYTTNGFQMRFTPAGRAVGHVRVGCGGSKDKEGTFINIVLWDELAELINSKVVDKGMYVVADGELNERKWTVNKGERAGQQAHVLELLWVKRIWYLDDTTNKLVCTMAKSKDGAEVVASPEFDLTEAANEPDLPAVVASDNGGGTEVPAAESKATK